MRVRATLLTLIFAVVLSGCGSQGVEPVASRYVALGDSNASGSGLPTPDTGAPPNCYRTQSGYPALAQKRLKFRQFLSVACAGAGMNAFIRTMELYPSGEARPQFNALKGSEHVVSVTIGINDAGSGDITGTCLKNTNPRLTPCRDKFIHGSDNKLSDAAAALAKPLGGMLDAIHDRAPHAKIFVVGYPPIIPPDGAGCWGKVNVSRADAPIFYGWQQAISDTEKATAAGHNATYLDFFSAGAGHDACKSAAERWSNPAIGIGSAGWPFHPTIAGAQAAAKLLTEAVGAKNVQP